MSWQSVLIRIALCKLVGGEQRMKFRQVTSARVLEKRKTANVRGLPLV